MRARALLVLGLAWPWAVVAQQTPHPGDIPAPRPPAQGTPPSTSRLGNAERSVRFEFTAGRTVGGGSSLQDDKLAVTLAMAAVRWKGAGGAGVRLWGMWSRRSASWSGWMPETEFLVLGGALDQTMRLSRRTTLALSAGLGRAVNIRFDQDTIPDYGYRFSEEKMVLQAGLALRHRFLIVEPQVVVLGGDWYIPIAVGFRF